LQPRAVKEYRNPVIIVLALTAYTVYLALGVMHHAAWRDEWQSIHIVNAATSVSDLSTLLRYEGHPILWYLCTKVALILHPSLTSVQILNCSIALVTACLIALYAPWPLWLKLLSAFSGPMAWEFSIKARSYGLGWMLVVILALVIQRMNNRNKPWVIVFVATLAINTSIFTGLLACSLVAGWLWQEYRSNIRAVLLPIGTLALVIIGTFWLMIPPSDSAFGLAPLSIKLDKVDELTRCFAGTIMPIQYMATIPFLYLLLILAVVLLLLAGAICANAGSLIALISGWSATYVFILVKMNGCYPWHYWHFFALPFAVGIAFGRKHDTLHKGVVALAIVAFLGLGEGIKEYVHDWNTTYSAAKDAAQAISRAGLRDIPVLVMPDYFIPSLSGYLGKPLYDVTSNCKISYITWNKSRLKNVNWFYRAIELAGNDVSRSCLVSFPAPLSQNDISAVMTVPKINFTLFGQYVSAEGLEGRFASSEDYYMYILQIVT